MDKTIIILTILIAGILLPPNIHATHITETDYSTDKDMAQHTTNKLNLDIKPMEKPKNSKIESSIAELINMQKTAPYTPPHKLSTASGTSTQEPKIMVIVVMKDETKSLDRLSSIETIAKYKNQIQANIPINQIEKIAHDPNVRYIRMPLKPHTTLVSEGADTINATALHGLGITGAGVKIAVIDLGFHGYNTSPEIWNIAEAVSFRSDGDITGNKEPHGTACAELVLDVAPDASLYLYNIDSDITFASAVNHAISQGVDIITCSLGWVNAGPYDGTGDVCDIANNADANGILFVNSAGNQAKRHYEGTFEDTDADKWHEFSTTPKDEGLYLGYISNNDPITLFLSWNDWDTTDQDYDLYLTEWNGIEWKLIAGSINWQDGSPGQTPTEAIEYTSTGGIYSVAIRNYNSGGDARLELYSFHNNFAQYNIESSSLVIPADAAGVMTAGATYWQNDNLEPFSSQGPTNDRRTKPDVTAPDGVSNSVYGTIYGTSASAPHTAGAAALLLGAYPSLSKTELQYYLESTAKDLNIAGKDNLTGSGRIDVYAAYQALPLSININPENTEIIPGNTGYSTAEVIPYGKHSLTIEDYICKDTDKDSICEDDLPNPCDEISIVFENTGNLSTTTDPDGKTTIEIRLGATAPPGTIYTYYINKTATIISTSSQAGAIPEFQTIIVPILLTGLSLLLIKKNNPSCA